jgi:hypothetical protein
MMNTLKEIARFFLGLGIMLCSLIFALSIFTRTTVLNPTFYMHTLEKHSYFTYLEQEIKEGFANYSLITSIPAAVFRGAVSSEEIKSLTRANIQNTTAYLKHQSDYADTELDKSGIDLAVRKYASGLSGEESQLSTVTEEAAAIVNSHATLFDVSAVKKYSQFQSLREALYAVYRSLFFSAAGLLVLALFLFILSKGKKWTFQIWLGGAVLAASLIVLVPAIMGLIFNVPYRFAVENYYLKVGLSSIMVGYLDNLAIIGAAMLVAGAEILYLGIRRAEIKKIDEDEAMV